MSTTAWRKELSECRRDLRSAIQYLQDAEFHLAEAEAVDGPGGRGTEQERETIDFAIQKIEQLSRHLGGLLV